MKILITGSEGRLGTVLKKALVAKGHTVVDFDLSIDWSRDIRSPNCLKPFLPVNLVIHLAALTSVKGCQKEPSLAVDINVTGTRNVLQEAEKSGTPAVLVASSCEVYGDATTLPASETAPIRPINVYGRTKAISEDLTADARRHKLITAIIRLPNVYGSLTDSSRIIGAFARVAACGGTLRTADAQRALDFLHIDDAVSGLVATAELLMAGKERLPALHLATGYGTTIGNVALLAHHIATQAGKPTRIESGHAERYEVSSFIGNPRRAEKTLGWKAQISFDKGFRQLVAEILAATALKTEADEVPRSP